MLICISQGEDWFNVRSKVNPIMMQPRVVKQYINCMDSIASEFIDNVRYLVKSNPDGQMPKTFLNEIYKWAFESAGVIAMDKRFGKYSIYRFVFLMHIVPYCTIIVLLF